MGLDCGNLAFILGKDTVQVVISVLGVKRERLQVVISVLGVKRERYQAVLEFMELQVKFDLFSSLIVFYC